MLRYLCTRESFRSGHLPPKCVELLAGCIALSIFGVHRVLSGKGGNVRTAYLNFLSRDGRVSYPFPAYSTS